MTFRSKGCVETRALSPFVAIKPSPQLLVLQLPPWVPLRNGLSGTLSLTPSRASLPRSLPEAGGGAFPHQLHKVVSAEELLSVL